MPTCTQHGPSGPSSQKDPEISYRHRTKQEPPTNTVRNHRQISHRVTEWLLLSDRTPCDTYEWAILPGPSTHYALLFSLHYSTSVLRPTVSAHNNSNLRPPQRSRWKKLQQ